MNEAAIPVVERRVAKESFASSPRLQAQIITGEFDAAKQPAISANTKEVSQKSKDALEAHHQKLREDDNTRKKRVLKDELDNNPAEKERIKNVIAQRDSIDPSQVTEASIVHFHHMRRWADAEMANIVDNIINPLDGTKSQPDALRGLFALGISINTQNPSQSFLTIRNSLVISESGMPGEFYRKFCGPNVDTMSEIAKTLTLEQIHLLRPFLFDIVGKNETAFNALVAMKESMDAVADPNQLQRLAGATNQLSSADNSVLEFYRIGADLAQKEPNKKSTKPDNPPPDNPPDQPPAQPTPEPSTIVEKHPLKGIAGSAEIALHTPNEDTKFIDPDHLRGGIFDGAGGELNPDAASNAAKNGVQKIFDMLPQNPTLEQVQKAVEDALKQANTDVIDQTNGQGKSTGAIFHIWEGPNGEKKLVIGNVGDSRVWVRKANGDVTPLTTDQGYLLQALQTEPGIITPEQFKEIQNIIETAHTEDDLKKLDDYKIPSLKTARFFWDNRRYLTNALGSANAKITNVTFDIEPGDMVFLTTDGVHDNLALQDIEDIARTTNNPDQFAHALVDRAKKISDSSSVRAKPDDISAIALLLETTQESDSTKNPKPPQTQGEQISSFFQGVAEGFAGSHTEAMKRKAERIQKLLEEGASYKQGDSHYNEDLRNDLVDYYRTMGVNYFPSYNINSSDWVDLSILQSNAALPERKTEALNTISYAISHIEQGASQFTPQQRRDLFTGRVRIAMSPSRLQEVFLGQGAPDIHTVLQQTSDGKRELQLSRLLSPQEIITINTALQQIIGNNRWTLAELKPNGSNIDLVLQMAAVEDNS